MGNVHGESNESTPAPNASQIVRSAAAVMISPSFFVIDKNHHTNEEYENQDPCGHHVARQSGIGHQKRSHDLSQAPDSKYQCPHQRISGLFMPHQVHNQQYE